MSAPPLHHSLMERGQGVRPMEFNFSFTCTIISVQTKEWYWNTNPSRPSLGKGRRENPVNPEILRILPSIETILSNVSIKRRYLSGSRDSAKLLTPDDSIECVD